VKEAGFGGAASPGAFSPADHKRQGDQVNVIWDPATVTITDADGVTIAQYAKLGLRRGWHGPRQKRPSTKS